MVFGLNSNTRNEYVTKIATTTTTKRIQLFYTAVVVKWIINSWEIVGGKEIEIIRVINYKLISKIAVSHNFHKNNNFIKKISERINEKKETSSLVFLRTNHYCL